MNLNGKNKSFVVRLLSLSVAVKSIKPPHSQHCSGEDQRSSSAVSKPVCRADSDNPMRPIIANFSHTENVSVDDALRFFIAGNNLSHARFVDEGARLLAMYGDTECISRTSLIEREIAHPFLDALRFAAAHGSAFVLNPHTLWHLVCDGIAHYFQSVEPVAKHIKKRRHMLKNGASMAPYSNYLNVEPTTLAADNPLGDESSEAVREAILTYERNFFVSTPPRSALASMQTSIVDFSGDGGYGDGRGGGSEKKTRKLDDPPATRFKLDLLSERLIVPNATETARNMRYACIRVPSAAAASSSLADAFDSDDEEEDDYDDGEDDDFVTTYRVERYEIECRAREWLELFSNMYEFALHEPFSTWLGPLLCVVYAVLQHHKRLMKESDDDYPKMSAEAAAFVFGHAKRLQLTLSDLGADLARFFWCDEVVAARHKERRDATRKLHLHGIALFLFPAACGIMSACHASKHADEIERLRAQHIADLLQPDKSLLSTAAFVNELRVYDVAMQTPIKTVTMRGYTGFVGFVFHAAKNAVVPSVQSFVVVEKDEPFHVPLSLGFPTVAPSDTRAKLERRVLTESSAVVRDMIRLIDLNGGSTATAFARVLSLTDSKSIELTCVNHWPVSQHESVDGCDFNELLRPARHGPTVKVDEKDVTFAGVAVAGAVAGDDAEQDDILVKPIIANDVEKTKEVVVVVGNDEETVEQMLLAAMNVGEDAQQQDSIETNKEKKGEMALAEEAANANEAAAEAIAATAAATCALEKEQKRAEKRAEKRAAKRAAKERQAAAMQARIARERIARVEREAARAQREAEAEEREKELCKQRMAAESKKKAEKIAKREKKKAEESKERALKSLSFPAESKDDAVLAETTILAKSSSNKETEEREAEKPETEEREEKEAREVAVDHEICEITLGASALGASALGEKTNDDDEKESAQIATKQQQQQQEKKAPLPLVVLQVSAGIDQTVILDRFVRRCVPPTALYALEAPIHVCKMHRCGSVGGNSVDVSDDDRESLLGQIVATCDAHFPCGQCCVERNDWYWSRLPMPLYAPLDESSRAAKIFRGVFDELCKARPAFVATACVFCKQSLSSDGDGGDKYRTSLLFNGVNMNGAAQLRIMFHCATRCDGSFDNLPFAAALGGGFSGDAAGYYGGGSNGGGGIIARGLSALFFSSGCSSGGVIGGRAKTYLRLQTMSNNVLDDLLFQINDDDVVIGGATD